MRPFGSTAIAPYSVRDRKGAPVAVPVTWEEVTTLPGAGAFSMGDMEDRLSRACPAETHAADPQSLTDRVIGDLQAWAAEG